MTPTPQCDLFTGLVSGALRVDHHLLHFVFSAFLFFVFVGPQKCLFVNITQLFPAVSKGSGFIEDSCMFLGQGPSRTGKVYLFT